MREVLRLFLAGSITNREMVDRVEGIRSEDAAMENIGEELPYLYEEPFRGAFKVSTPPHGEYLGAYSVPWAVHSVSG